MTNAICSRNSMFTIMFLGGVVCCMCVIRFVGQVPSLNVPSDEYYQCVSCWKKITWYPCISKIRNIIQIQTRQKRIWISAQHQWTFPKIRLSTLDIALFRILVLKMSKSFTFAYLALYFRPQFLEMVTQKSVYQVSTFDVGGLMFGWNSTLLGKLLLAYIIFEQ